MTFLCMIALRSKTVAHTFVSSFDNPSGRLCQERLLRSRNFVPWKRKANWVLSKEAGKEGDGFAKEERGRRKFGKNVTAD